MSGYLVQKLALFSILIFSSTSLEYKRGLTEHFVGWLNQTGYEPYGFNRTEFFGGSFGGKEYEDQPITKKPVIFVHGNADMLIGEIDDNNGFRHSIEYFLSRGYTKAELYGSMWGFADIYHMGGHTHQQEYVMYVRTFIEAVLEYTGAEQVHVISHSMGCTFARRALKGGWSSASRKPYFIGDTLFPKIDTFISIAGGHMGIPRCQFSNTRSCNNLDGYYPGDQDAQPFPNQSKFLYEMNTDPQKEAEHTYSIFSWNDGSDSTLITFGRNTCEWPTMDASYGFSGPEWTHLVVRDNTTEMQYNLVNYHQFFVNETQQVQFLQ